MFDNNSNRPYRAIVLANNDVFFHFTQTYCFSFSQRIKFSEHIYFLLADTIEFHMHLLEYFYCIFHLNMKYGLF